MTEKIGPDEVKHVAHLARLQLSEAEIASMTRDLNAMLEYVAKLSELDTTDVEPTPHAIVLSNPMRDDVPRPGLKIERVLQNAPEADERSFVVPKVV